MKLVLANNQTDKFIDFHKEVQAGEKIYDYAGYQSLLFSFSVDNGEGRLNFVNVLNGKYASDYKGVYINGYLNTPEIAYTCATVLDNLNIDYINKELGDAPSLSKLTMYAKLVDKNVLIPRSYGGAAYAMLNGTKYMDIKFPSILKRADADRGVDNFMIHSEEELIEILSPQEERSLWILQDFIPNDGFYLVSIYNNQPAFGIYRSLEERPDKDTRKAHMFKPFGGANAHFYDVKELPASLVKESINAVKVMNRQMASVDSIFDASSERTYILEVNYNPQLVTIETYKDARRFHFIETIKNLGNED